MPQQKSLLSRSPAHTALQTARPQFAGRLRPGGAALDRAYQAPCSARTGRKVRIPRAGGQSSDAQSRLAASRLEPLLRYSQSRCRLALRCAGRRRISRDRCRVAARRVAELCSCRLTEPARSSCVLPPALVREAPAVAGSCRASRRGSAARAGARAHRRSRVPRRLQGPVHEASASRVGQPRVVEHPAAAEEPVRAKRGLPPRLAPLPGLSENITATTFSSRKIFRYGYFEARMKLTKGNGAWPAFWLMSNAWARRGADNCSLGIRAAEIDVFEGYGNHPRVFTGTIHRNSAEHVCAVAPGRDQRKQLAAEERRSHRPLPHVCDAVDADAGDVVPRPAQGHELAGVLDDEHADVPPPQHANRRRIVSGREHAGRVAHPSRLGSRVAKALIPSATTDCSPSIQRRERSRSRRKSGHETVRRAALILGCACRVPADRRCSRRQSRRSGRPPTPTSDAAYPNRSFRGRPATTRQSGFTPSAAGLRSLRGRRFGRPGHQGETALLRHGRNSERARRLPDRRLADDAPHVEARRPLSSAAPALTRAGSPVAAGSNGT